MQILTENDREGKNISFQTGVEIEILIPKKELSYYRQTRDQFRETISAKKRADAENDIQKSQYKISELNSARDHECWKANKKDILY